MLAARPHIEPRRVPGADSVVVSEIYLSLQGESSHQGLLCSFVRLTGCHLRCRWCDSAFAFQGGTRMAVAEVVERVKALGSPRVEVTGGEPLLQPGVYPLMEALLAEGLAVLLETSGAIDVRLVPPAVHKIVDVKCPGSGEADRNDWRCLESMTARDELKFVLASPRGLRVGEGAASPSAVSIAGRPGCCSRRCTASCRPTELAEWIIADRLPVRFQLQQHKVLWAPDARGV